MRAATLSSVERSMAKTTSTTFFSHQSCWSLSVNLQTRLAIFDALNGHHLSSDWRQAARNARGAVWSNSLQEQQTRPVVPCCLADKSLSANASSKRGKSVGPFKSDRQTASEPSLSFNLASRQLHHSLGIAAKIRSDSQWTIRPGSECQKWRVYYRQLLKPNRSSIPSKPHRRPLTQSHANLHRVR